MTSMPQLTPLKISDYDSGTRPKSTTRSKPKVDARLYKTNLCRTYSRTNTCPYGPKCQFAHGESELRPVPPELAQTPSSVPTSPLLSPRSISVLNAGVNSPLFQRTPLSTRHTPAETDTSRGPSIQKISLFPSPQGSSAGAKTSPQTPIPQGAHVDCDPNLYKTELCRSYNQHGSCRYGFKCQFAHGLDELRPMPPKTPVTEAGASPSLSKLVIDDQVSSPETDRWSALKPRSRLSASETPSGTSRVVKDPRTYKTEMCKTFETEGACPYNEKCQFAHGKKEIRSRGAMTTSAINDGRFPSLWRATSIESSPSTPNRTDHRYKTELCRSYNKSGYCRYGLKCQFAHGIHELRAPPPSIAGDEDTELSSLQPRRLQGSPVISPRSCTESRFGFIRDEPQGEPRASTKSF